MIKEIQREFKKKYWGDKSQKPEVIIENFRTNLLSELSENISGIYVIGSYGLEDFNINLSDIDFIVSIEKDLSDEQIQTIKRIHTEIEREVLKPNLNGIYIKQEHLGKTSKEIDRLTYFHEGELNTDYNKSNHYEINPITWTELKSNGVVIYEKQNNEIELKVDWKEVDKYMYENINSYWKKWLTKSNNYFHSYYYRTLLRKSENAWCVSGVSRQLYTLIEQKITSKRRACEYFIDKFPVNHTKILEDTINYRKGLPTRKSWKQKGETIDFIEYCILRFNEEYKKKYDN